MSDRELKFPAPDGPDHDAEFDHAVVGFMSELVRDLGTTLELDELLMRVATEVKELVRYDTFAVLLLEDLGQQLYFHFARGFSEDVVRRWRFGMGQGLVGTAAQTQERVRVGDVRADPRYIGAASSDVRSEMSIPLIVKGRTIGVLDLASRKLNHFTEQHERLITYLAGHLANAIENSRLYARVRDQARRLSLLHETSRELTSILDRDRLLRTVGTLVKRLIDYHLFSVLLWNEQSQQLEHAFSMGFDEGFCKKGGFPLGYGVTGTAAALRQSIRVPNVHLNPHYVDCGHSVEVRSELASPLVFKDRLIGVLDLESIEYNAFTEQHEQLLSTLASYIAVALENAQLYEKLAENERRLEDDLETAREIQKGLLPKEAPAVPGLDVGYSYSPARQLGGDFYDFLSYGPDRLAFAVGDVAGKGTPAALYGAMAVGILRGHVVEQQCNPAGMLAELNRQLSRHGIDNRYAAMVFGVYDGAKRTLILGNGGFPHPVLVRGGEVRELPVAGVPLGMFDDSRHEEMSFNLRAGDVVAIFSDGICESMDSHREEFGARKLKQILVDRSGDSAQQIADELLRAAQQYVPDSAREADDRTVVVLKVG